MDVIKGKAGLDTTDFKTGVAGMNRELRLLESGFRASAAGLGDWANDASGLELRMKSLTSQIEIQQRKVEATRAEYERMAAEEGAGSRAAQDMEIKLNKETESLGKMQVELRETGGALENLRGGLDASGRSTDELGDKQESLGTRMKNTWTEINSFIGVAKQVFQVLKGVVDATVGSFVEYADQVREISQVTGQSAEDVSRMIQLTDDYKIETDSLTTVMKKLAADGMPLTVDALAQLSDEYLKLNPGTERQLFLTEKFGRAGVAFAEIMLQGGDAIREQAGAISGSLVLTEDALQKAREYEKATDELNDAWTAFKTSIGQEVVPHITKLVTAHNLGIRANKLGISTTKYQLSTQKGYARILAEVEEAEKALAEVQKRDRLPATYKLTEAVDEATEAEKDYADQLAGVSSLGEILTRQTEDMDKALQDVTDAQLEFDNALASGTGVDEAAQKIQDARQAVKDLRDEQQKQTDQWMLNCLQQALGVNGITSAEMDYLLKYQVDTGLITAEAAERAQAQWDAAMRMVDAFEQTQDAANGITEAVNAIPNVERTVTINTVYSMTGQERAQAWLAQYGGAQAEGGDYVVDKPTMFLAGEAGPERVTFTPLGKSLSQLGAAMRGLTSGMNAGGGGQAAGVNGRGGMNIQVGDIIIQMGSNANPLEVGRVAEQGVLKALRAAGAA